MMHGPINIRYNPISSILKIDAAHNTETFVSIYKTVKPNKTAIQAISSVKTRKPK